MNALALSVVARLASNLCHLPLHTRGNGSAGAYDGGVQGWLLEILQMQHLELATRPEPRRIERFFCLMEVVGIESEGGIVLFQSADLEALIDQRPKAVGR